MAKRPGTDDGLLVSPTILRDFSVGVNARDGNMDCIDGAAELSLEEILVLYSQPINEEQAWAVCYQCCRTLARTRRGRNAKSADASSAGDGERRIDGPGDVRIQRDGTVILQYQDTADLYTSAHTSLEVIESLGIMVYKALDYGLKESEERELSPPLERLIDLMTKATDAGVDHATAAGDGDPCPDEGYEATEEEDEEEEEREADEGPAAHGVRNVRSYRDIITLCSSHLPSPSDAPDHYQAVCRALYAETRELSTFLEKIKNAKENLRKMDGDRWEQPVKDLDDLQNADWARFWVQVMRDLRHGVKLKKVQERQYNPLPIEFQLTPYEMLMDDIRSKRYKLRKVMVNGNIPPRLKKSAHEVILDFIRSRPPLNPAAARKLKPHPPRPRSLHERLLADIKAERKLRPVSPDMIRRHRLGAGKSISTPQDLFRSSDTPDAPRKLLGSTQSLANGLPGATGAGGGGVGGAAALSQRKRLLHAPTLAELDSSESEEDTTQSSSSKSTSMLEDMSPEAVPGRKKVPPNFLPVSAAATPRRQQPSPRRHSIEKETPTSVRPFLPPTRQSSKSLLKADPSAKEEFCYPVECLALTVEEVMHIRQVLVKAELEKFQQYKDIYTALKKGKLCFSCRTKKFSLFTWSYNCQFCKRPVCSQCCRKMRLPSKPYCTLPIYSLGPSAVSRDDSSVVLPSSSSPADRSPFGSAQNRHSLRRTMSKLSKQGSRDGWPPDEPQLPKELTEDWATMEVCVDCKKFITEIISSSKRSLSVASKRARLNRKTQSFYLTSAKSTDFRSTERTINEV